MEVPHILKVDVVRERNVNASLKRSSVYVLKKYAIRFIRFLLGVKMSRKSPFAFRIVTHDIRKHQGRRPEQAIQ